ncbi:hypothetical protein RFI_26325, partial [Reticulomyxa filosa]
WVSNEVIKPGINLKSCCPNPCCLSKHKRSCMWINKGFGAIEISFGKIPLRFRCCNKIENTSVTEVIFSNCEYSISTSDHLTDAKMGNHYQYRYDISPELTYKLIAMKIRQHAKKCARFNYSNEAMINLVKELEKNNRKVIKVDCKHNKVTLMKKAQEDCSRVFDFGKYMILCDNGASLETAISVLMKAERFGLVMSEDDNFFGKKSSTHFKFRNVKLYVPTCDIYMEMRVTLKKFVVLEGYDEIEGPKLSHLFNEIIEAWEPRDFEGREMKNASKRVLRQINDVICEWLTDKEMQQQASDYKPHSMVQILDPPQLLNKTDKEIDNNIPLKMAQFVFRQLCTFTPNTVKGQAIYVILYTYYKRYIVGVENLASRVDLESVLQDERKKELKNDKATRQALNTYIPLWACNEPYNDNKKNQRNNCFDCRKYVIRLLAEKNEEEKTNKQKQPTIIVLFGQAGIGKSFMLSTHLRRIVGVTFEGFHGTYSCLYPIVEIL